MRERVTVVGCGQMGLVMADAVLAAGVPDVRVWGPAGPMIEDLRATRTNHDRLEHFTLPDDIAVHDDPAAALDGATIVIHAIPVQASASAWGVLAPHLGSGVIVASAAKGIEVGTYRLPTHILADVIETDVDLAVVSGPTIASELVDRKPAVMVAAAAQPDAAERLQQALHAPWLRIYASDDVVGVELAGAAKNVIAIAAGICDGLELGDNAKSAVLSRGLAEITRLGVAYGAKSETFFGIAGVGDLATTCFSPFGRNRTFGEALGRGESPADFLQRTGATVEGMSTAQSITAVAAEVDVEMPIADAIYAVLYEGVAVGEAFDSLMARDMGSEW